MDLGLKGAKVLVTGGTKGIGRAIAETFAAEGAAVGLCARNADEVASAVAALEKAGAKAFGGVADVSNGPALKAWVADMAAKLGGIDVVVANVSALAIGADEESWAKGFATDMMGTVRLVDAAMPYLEKSQQPAIVTVSSVSGREVDFAPTAPSRRRSSTTRRAWPISSPARASAPTRCRPATPISKAASGRTSRTAIPICTRPRWR